VIPGEDGRIEGKQITAPAEGVFIHGLFLEGAGWSKAEKRLEDSQPKELYYQFPIILVTAISTAPPADARAGAAAGKGGKIDIATLDKTMFSCPVYKYPKRNDKYLIFRVKLQPEPKGAPPGPNKGVTSMMKWRLCGAALLCCKA
jgi:dynein heavy chain